MKILAVDTSSSNCSVSITEVDENKNFNIIVSKNNNDKRLILKSLCLWLTKL